MTIYYIMEKKDCQNLLLNISSLEWIFICIIFRGSLDWDFSFSQIKKPRTSSFVRLVLLPSGHTVYKVDTLTQYVRISGDQITLQFAMPNAALSMDGSYAILIDQGAVVGQGCSYDGPPTPGITSSSDWTFVIHGICAVGYYLAPPGFTNCVGT